MWLWLWSIPDAVVPPTGRPGAHGSRRKRTAHATVRHYGSTAIAATMHLTRPWWITRLWLRANTTGHTRLAEGIAALLRQMGSGQTVTCSLASEPGTDLLHP